MKSIKLNRLNANELDSKSANQVRGGYNTGANDPCCCGCLYANTGGSNFEANGQANDDRKLKTPGVICLDPAEVTPASGQTSTQKQ